MQRRYRGVLFDLDGTLIDNFQAIYRSYTQAMERLGRPPASYEAVRHAVGGSIQVTMRKFVEEAVAEDALRHYHEAYGQYWNYGVTVYSGAAWILQSLHEQGLTLAVLTNKEGPRARALLRLTGLDVHLDAIFGSTDTPWRKPQAAFTQHALANLGLTASESCVVGDGPYDVATAREAGLDCYLVATGSHTAAELEKEVAVRKAYPDLWALGQDVFGLTRPSPAERG